MVGHARAHRGTNVGTDVGGGGGRGQAQGFTLVFIPEGVGGGRGPRVRGVSHLLFSFGVGRLLYFFGGGRAETKNDTAMLRGAATRTALAPSTGAFCLPAGPFGGSAHPPPPVAPFGCFRDPPRGCGH